MADVQTPETGAALAQCIQNHKILCSNKCSKNIYAVTSGKGFFFSFRV